MAGGKAVAIDLIRLDGSTQSRAQTSEETVAEYAEQFKDKVSWPFPPVVLFDDGNGYWLSSGFHRVLAAVRAKRISVCAVIRKGTATDAFIEGCKDNHKHGLRYNRADKEHMVKRALEHEPGASGKRLAAMTGLNERYCRQIRTNLQEKSGDSGTPMQTLGTPSNGMARPEQSRPHTPSRGGIENGPKSHVEPPPVKTTEAVKATARTAKPELADTLADGTCGQCREGELIASEWSGAEYCPVCSPEFVREELEAWHKSFVGDINRGLRKIKQLCSTPLGAYFVHSQLRAEQALKEAKNQIWMLRPVESTEEGFLTEFARRQASK